MPEPVTSTSLIAGITGIDPDFMAKAGAFMSGIVGGIISMRFVKGMTKWERATGIVAGAVMAHYIASPIAFLFGVGEYVETVGFLVGMFGMSICGALFDAIKKSDIWGLIEKRVLGAESKHTVYDNPDAGGNDQ